MLPTPNGRWDRLSAIDTVRRVTESAPTSETWETVNLHYFFWLPAGKDEFGFGEYSQAPLYKTALYRKQLEQTISARLTEQMNALRDPATNKLAFMEPTTPNIRDAELGLRKVHFTFDYEPSRDGLDGLIRSGSLIKGTGVVLSNGLYLWAFRIEYRREREAELRQILERFLVEDFIERHVRRVLDFDWVADQTTDAISRYHGVLTYFQLDLLFNGVLDPAGHPHLALDDRKNDSSDSDEQDARRSYTIQSLVESLSLYAIAADNTRTTEYLPLFDKRKSYTTRTTGDQEHPYIDANIDLRDDAVPTGKELEDRELLLSRLTFAGMEQFLRVAISFGLTHYKTGLDHIRAELVDIGMKSYKNRASGELRRPSLAAKVLTIADLEAHHTLLAGKVPIVTFLLDLVNGLAEVSEPLRKPQLNGRDGSAEWLFAKSTLDESLTQFRRQIKVIEADVKAIETSLNAVRTDMMLLELTEARKLQEITAESERKSVDVIVPQLSVPRAILQLADDARLRLDARDFERPIAVLALIIGGFEVISGGLFFVTQNMFTSDSTLIWPDRLTLGHWLILNGWALGLLVLGGAAWLGLRMFRRTEQSKVEASSSTVPDEDVAEPAEPEPQIPHRPREETHVFDYSSLQEDIPDNNDSNAIMENLRTHMVDIEAPRDRDGICQNYSTFRETPSSGTERIKYSLESPLSASGLSYVLHVEVDRRRSGEERLRDIRLVIRRPVTANDIDLVAAATNIIRPCLQALVFTGDRASEVNDYMQTRMGLDPESTGSTKRSRR